MQKKLYYTYFNPHHNRLSMPINKLRYMFLTEEEISDLELWEEIGVKRMEAETMKLLIHRLIDVICL